MCVVVLSLSRSLSHLFLVMNAKCTEECNSVEFGCLPAAYVKKTGHSVLWNFEMGMFIKHINSIQAICCDCHWVYYRERVQYEEIKQTHSGLGIYIKW